MIDFAKITSQLYVGSCPRTDVDIKQLKSMGITGILSLQTNTDFEKWEINFPELEQASFDYDLPIQRLPIIDFDDQDLTLHIATAVKKLHRMIAVGHTVYVHCTAGQERAPSVVTAYLIRHQSMDNAQAEQLVKTQRVCSPKMHVIEAVFALQAKD